MNFGRYIGVYCEEKQKTCGRIVGGRRSSRLRRARRHSVQREAGFPLHTMPLDFAAHARQNSAPPPLRWNSLSFVFLRNMDKVHMYRLSLLIFAGLIIKNTIWYIKL